MRVFAGTQRPGGLPVGVKKVARHPFRGGPSIVRDDPCTRCRASILLGNEPSLPIEPWDGIRAADRLAFAGSQAALNDAGLCSVSMEAIRAAGAGI